MDYTIDYFYKYNGKKWMVLQNGEEILFVKRSAIIRLDKDKYSLLYDSEHKIKEVSYNIADVDIITIIK